MPPFLVDLFAEGRYADAIAMIESRAMPAPGGCLVYSGKPYPQVRFGQRQKRPVHRLILEAKMGGRSIVGWHAHHVCGNSRCVAAAHIVPATARQNVGEMLARQTYEAEIRSLRSALAEANPAHPLLRGDLTLDHLGGDPPPGGVRPPEGA